jgi:hypothetical protein
MTDFGIGSMPVGTSSNKKGARERLFCHLMMFKFGRDAKEVAPRCGGAA